MPSSESGPNSGRSRIKGQKNRVELWMELAHSSRGGNKIYGGFLKMTGGQDYRLTIYQGYKGMTYRPGILRDVGFCPKVKEGGGDGGPATWSRRFRCYGSGTLNPIILNIRYNLSGISSSVAASICLLSCPNNGFILGQS